MERDLNSVLIQGCIKYIHAYGESADIAIMVNDIHDDRFPVMVEASGMDGRVHSLHEGDSIRVVGKIVPRYHVMLAVRAQAIER